MFDWPATAPSSLKSGEITSLAVGAHLGLVGSDAFIEDSTALGSNSALTGLALIDAGASFALHDGAAVSTTGALVNDGAVYLDTSRGDGGSSLTVGGTLTNSGHLAIGNAKLSASDKVTAASLINTGEIHLTGSSGNQALLDVTGSAGFVNGGTVFLENKAAVSTTGGFANVRTVQIDANPGDGGSSLAVGATLTNSGFFVIGVYNLSASDEVTAASLDNTGAVVLAGSSADQALLDVTGKAGFGAAGVLSGNIELAGSDDAIEFASGQITSLAASAILVLDGSDAFIEDSMALGSNSALTGLANVSGILGLSGGASISTTGALANTGTVALDDLDDAGDLYGGSSLTVAETLTNTGTLDTSNTILSASESVTVGRSI